jgi:hypothetical protein
MNLSRAIALAALAVILNGCREQSSYVGPPNEPPPLPPWYNEPAKDSPTVARMGFPHLAQPTDPEGSKGDWKAIRKHWEQYLETIQKENDYANWSEPPYEYYSTHKAEIESHSAP